MTLGLPVYNGERFLGESLDALLAQTYTDFELIIADNGSTDGTEEIARRYVAGDSRIRYVPHPENRGAAFNHNARPIPHVPAYLYFRREHPGRVSRAPGQIRLRCRDPARASRWRHPVLRLLAEYVLGYVVAIRRAPISRKDRLRCRATLVVWGLRHVSPAYRRQVSERIYPTSPAIDPGTPAARLTYTAPATSGPVDVTERREGGARTERP